VWCNVYGVTQLVPHYKRKQRDWRREVKGRFTHNMPFPCRAYAVLMPFPCHAVPLIHTCYAAPLPCSDTAVSFVKVRMVAGNIRTV